MVKFTPKHQLKVAGNMSEADAGKAGLILAVAGLIFAILAGIALIIWASRPVTPPIPEHQSRLRLADQCYHGTHICWDYKDHTQQPSHTLDG